ncbi:MAG: hypothetical protein NXY57DRAFT_1039420 [Lentinula lateritia]|nr:MAG: hypothetical protein NXY57DRAFT_1039420 [Lentinula lateritia]
MSEGDTSSIDANKEQIRTAFEPDVNTHLSDDVDKIQPDLVTQYICNVGFGGTVAGTKESPGTLKAASDPRIIAFDVVQKFPLDDCNESSENIFICCKPTDKNTNIKNYKRNEGHPTEQSPSPGSLDAVLSCWETGPQFSYYGCNLGAFDPTPWQRGSLTIPDREHDLIVQQQCYAPRIHNKVLTPDPLNIPQVQMREEDLEKVIEVSDGDNGRITTVFHNQFWRICMRTENVRVEARGKQRRRGDEMR